MQGSEAQFYYYVFHPKIGCIKHTPEDIQAVKIGNKVFTEKGKKK
jgi:hypothetical protein